MLMTLSVS